MQWFRSERGQKFVREVGSVVLGVLIALALGEVADAIRWQVRVHRSVAAMKTEAAGNAYNIAERAEAGRCIAARLATLDALLGEAARTGQLPAIHGIGMPPDRVVERAAYDVAVGQGTLLHLSGDDARDVALVYQVTTSEFPDRIAAERAAWGDLALLEGPGRAVDGETILAMRQAVAAARAASAAVVPVIARSRRLLASKDVAIEYGEHRDAAGLRREVAASTICRPLGR